MRKFKTIVRRISYVLLMSFIYLTAIPKLADTENLVITTYYPAPYGGYVSLLTTNNTWLARDAGSVGVGTAAPGEKLDVVGGVRASGAIYSTQPGGYSQTYLQQWGLLGNGDIYIEPAGGRTLYLTDQWRYTGTLDIRFGNTQFNTGNVYIANSLGIGTWPSYRLDVNGTTRTVDLIVQGYLYGLCTWRWDDGGYYWHSCASGERIVGFVGSTWTSESVCGDNVGGQCSWGGTKLVPSAGYMICCRIQ
jgi:hypothetical protein